MRWRPGGCALSDYGGFPPRLTGLSFSFRIESVASDTPIASLEFMPYGYEFDRENGMYGVYFAMTLEGEGDSSRLRYPFSDFLHPSKLRDLAAFISGPAPDVPQVALSGEITRLAFSWQEDGRLRIQGAIGTEGWGSSTLEKQFKAFPFALDLRIKCSVTRTSLQLTLADLETLLQELKDIESKTSDNW